MASKQSHEPSATPSRRKPQNKRKRPSSVSAGSPPPPLSSLPVVNPTYASKTEIQEVLPELKDMKLDKLVMRQWALKDPKMCKEFLEVDTGRGVHLGKHRLKIVEWDSSATFARVYGLPTEGAVLEDLEVHSAHEYFKGAPHHRKDGYFLEECTNKKLSKLLKVLNPILLPGRSNQVPRRIVAAVAKAWLSPEFQIDWAEILRRIFFKLKSGSDSKSYRCYLSPYLFHVYHEFLLLSSDEQEHLKVLEESYSKTGRGLSEDAPEVTSFADKFQASTSNLTGHFCHFEDAENIAVKASSNQAESSILSKEDQQGSNARLFPRIARDSCEIRATLQANAVASLNHSETSEFQQQRTEPEPGVLPGPSTYCAFASPEQSIEVGVRETWHPSAGPSSAAASSGLMRTMEMSVPKEPTAPTSSRTQDRMADFSIATSLQIHGEETYRASTGSSIVNACEDIKKYVALWEKKEESHRRWCRQARQELHASITQKEGEMTDLKDRNSILFQQVNNLQKQVQQLTEKLDIVNKTAIRRQEIFEQLQALR